MRSAPAIVIAAAVGLLSLNVPAGAQTYYRAPEYYPQQYSTPKKRTQIIVRKRSYLDAGTTVKPGSMHYHDYAFGPASRVPMYGPPGSETSLGGGRWPLLRWWEY